MVMLTRAEGSWVGDLDLTRRSMALALAGGYAVSAFSAEADPVHTDEGGLLTATVAIPTADREIPGYLARPATDGAHATILVNSEIFGVHEWVRDVCRRLAKAGYAALAPDFFVRAGDPSKLEDISQVIEIVKATPGDQVISDTAAALSFLKAQPYADVRRLGVTGFCWGGGETWLCCERFSEFRAGVAWYGPLKAGAYPRTPPIDLVKDLKAPVLGLYGGMDKGISAKDVEDMRAAIRAAGKTAEIIVYPRAQHGFLADYRPSYDPEAAKDGWARMLAFFKANGVA